MRNDYYQKIGLDFTIQKAVSTNEVIHQQYQTSAARVLHFDIQKMLLIKPTIIVLETGNPF